MTQRRVEELGDYWTPLLVRVCAEHGVFDAFGLDDRSIADVAREVGWDPGVLARVVRALSASGLFQPADGGRHRLSDIGRRLVSTQPGSLAGLAPFSPWELHAWAEVVHALRTGRPSFDVHFGRTYWEHLGEDTAAAARFNVQMQRRTSALLDLGLEAYDWPSEGVVVDVGGGNGLLLQRVLRLRPVLSGVLFDLPAVVSQAGPLGEPDVSARATVVAGDVFVDDVPSGGDIYVMASVLHDWPDPDAVAILRRCRAAMGPDARLLLFESVIADDTGWHLAKLIDLHMLVLFGAKERTEQEWRALLAEAGFEVTGVVPTRGLSWIEARPSTHATPGDPA